MARVAPVLRGPKEFADVACAVGVEVLRVGVEVVKRTSASARWAAAAFLLMALIGRT